jgi:hypothetical protein
VITHVRVIAATTYFLSSSALQSVHQVQQVASLLLFEVTNEQTFVPNRASFLPQAFAGNKNLSCDNSI